MYAGNDPKELTPYPDRLGFIMSERKGKRVDITYHEARKRFECTMRIPKADPPVLLRMPLARLSASPEGSKFSPTVPIGIPSTKP